VALTPGPWVRAGPIAPGKEGAAGAGGDRAWRCVSGGRDQPHAGCWLWHSGCHWTGEESVEGEVGGKKEIPEKRGQRVEFRGWRQLR
jgi:hypothetical protein